MMYFSYFNNNTLQQKSICCSKAPLTLNIEVIIRISAELPTGVVQLIPRRDEQHLHKDTYGPSARMGKTIILHLHPLTLSYQPHIRGEN